MRFIVGGAAEGQVQTSHRPCDLLWQPLSPHHTLGGQDALDRFTLDGSAPDSHGSHQLEVHEQVLWSCNLVHSGAMNITIAVTCGKAPKRGPA